MSPVLVESEPFDGFARGEGDLHFSLGVESVTDNIVVVGVPLKIDGAGLFGGVLEFLGEIVIANVLIATDLGADVLLSESLVLEALPLGLGKLLSGQVQVVLKLLNDRLVLRRNFPSD